AVAGDLARLRIRRRRLLLQARPLRRLVRALSAHPSARPPDRIRGVAQASPPADRDRVLAGVLRRYPCQSTVRRRSARPTLLRRLTADVRLPGGGRRLRWQRTGRAPGKSGRQVRVAGREAQPCWWQRVRLLR